MRSNLLVYVQSNKGSKISLLTRPVLRYYLLACFATEGSTDPSDAISRAKDARSTEVRSTAIACGTKQLRDPILLLLVGCTASKYQVLRP